MKKVSVTDKYTLMTRQEAFELLPDVVCINATLNTLVFYDTNFKNKRPLKEKMLHLSNAFPWWDTEQGSQYWFYMDAKLRKRMKKHNSNIPPKSNH